MNRPMAFGGGIQLPGGVSERTARSVFAYDIAEDQLKLLFSQVGTIASFRLVTDRETGKPKGYGFCEFIDQKTAELAIRNLNGFEIGGRNLRVDSAANGERPAEEVLQLQQEFAARQEDTPYGPVPAEGKAAEAISRAVSSLPPEKMFEIMKQLKDHCKANPQDAKKTLMDNPQLCYALLQAQVVMRIVDPQVALAMLHRETPASTQPLHTMTIPQAPMSHPPPGMPMHPQQIAPRPEPVPPKPTEEDSEAALLMQVMSLTPEELAMLPAGDRERVIELRNTLRSSIAK